MFKEGVQDKLNKFDEDLVSLVAVKKRVKEIAILLVLDKMRCKLGFKTFVSLTGAPGTIKTTNIVRMGQILAKMVYPPRQRCPCHQRHPRGPVRWLHGPKTKETHRGDPGLLVAEWRRWTRAHSHSSPPPA